MDNHRLRLFLGFTPRATPFQHAMVTKRRKCGIGPAGVIVYLLEDFLILNGFVDRTQERIDHVAQVGFGHSANLVMDDFTACDEQHRRDALDTVIHGPFRIFVRVDFCDHHFSIILTRDLL